MLLSNEEFERLINFKQVFNFNNEKLLGSVDRGVYHPVVYRHSLEVLLTLWVKITGHSSVLELLELTK